MDVKIVERVVGHVTVLDIVGRLTIHRGAEHLKDKINSLIGQGRIQIALISRTCPISTAVVLGSWWRPWDRLQGRTAP